MTGRRRLANRMLVSQAARSTWTVIVEYGVQLPLVDLGEAGLRTLRPAVAELGYSHIRIVVVRTDAGHRCRP